MEDLSLHILDIAENSISVGAKNVEIVIIEDSSKDVLTLEINDDGKGMDPEVVKIVKSITAREIFKRVPGVKRQLWGGEFWTKGHFISTVGRHGNKEAIKNYVKNQGRSEKDYKKLHRQELQLELF